MIRAGFRLVSADFPRNGMEARTRGGWSISSKEGLEVHALSSSVPSWPPSMGDGAPTALTTLWMWVRGDHWVQDWAPPHRRWSNLLWSWWRPGVAGGAHCGWAPSTPVWGPSPLPALKCHRNLSCEAFLLKLLILGLWEERQKYRHEDSTDIGAHTPHPPPSVPQVQAGSGGEAISPPCHHLCLDGCSGSPWVRAAWICVKSVNTAVRRCESEY